MIRRKPPKKVTDKRVYVYLKWKDKNIVCLINLAKYFYRISNKNPERLVARLSAMPYPKAVNLFNSLFKSEIDLIHS